tara:strand:+ start:685 stop:1548 length:864 start_codon:yes stop_codon:yes gene_type:complete
MPTKYAKPSGNQDMVVDPSLLKKEFFKIYFTHLATSQKVKFNGWVTQFSDQFSSNWNTETVYGRMDPLATFQGTQRTISLGFDIVSKDAAEAEANLINVNRLIEFLYPVYNDGELSNQNTLKAAPLIGLKWTNLIANARNGEELVGYLDGVTYAPSIDAGGFMGTPGQRTIETNFPDKVEEFNVGDRTFTKEKYIGNHASTKVYIPKQLSLNLNYTVIHTHLMGWSGTTFSGPDVNGKFPNSSGIRLESEIAVQQIYDDEGNLVDEVELSRGPVVRANRHEVLGRNK